MGRRIGREPGEVGSGPRGGRFHALSPERAANEQLRPRAGGLFLSYQMRFCSSCNSMKPRNKRPMVKGWKCNDCQPSPAAARPGPNLAP